MNRHPVSRAVAWLEHPNTFASRYRHALRNESVCRQSMFSIKDDYGFSALDAMTVRATDYNDPNWRPL